MKVAKKQFLGLASESISFQDAQVVILPLEYEGGVSFGKGTSRGPEAVIEASNHLELYDEVLDTEPCSVGICTIDPPDLPDDSEQMIYAVHELTKSCLDQNKFVVSIGGDHSITSATFKAFADTYGSVSVVQFDAHADLRDTYEDSPHSHACVMSRILEMTSHSLQIGIRSLSAKEAQRIKDEQLRVGMMHQIRTGIFDLESELQVLPDPVYITFDVDVSDWSVIRSTGTPEPGGLLWDETIQMLTTLFSRKNVIGFDVVELSHDTQDINSAFAAAKLVYKMIGLKFFGGMSSQ